MAHVDFISSIHKSTTRDYLKRVTDHDKAAIAENAIFRDAVLSAVTAMRQEGPRARLAIAG